MGRKVAWERNFRDSIQGNPAWSVRYGTLWAEIGDLQRQVARLAPVLNGLSQGGLLRSRTFETALLLLQFSGAAASGMVPDSELVEIRQEVAGARVDPELDVAILSAQLEDARTLLGNDDPWVTMALGGRAPEDAARAIVGESAVVDSVRRATLLAQPGSVGTSTDQAIRLMRGALPRLQQAYQQYQEIMTQMEVRTSTLARALFDVFGTSIAPDATFTLRIADGVIKGYSYNGTEAPWHTTFHGVYDRHFSFPGREEWALPSRWRTPPPAFDLKTAMNMVSTNDIIGGNSGSPMIDREGRVVGLVFDGNIESLSGDFIYTTETSRAVSVHSEGILEALRDLYGARRIVDELSRARP
jgi:hypothetical protein